MLVNPIFFAAVLSVCGAASLRDASLGRPGKGRDCGCCTSSLVLRVLTIDVVLLRSVRGRRCLERFEARDRWRYVCYNARDPWPQDVLGIDVHSNDNSSVSGFLEYGRGGGRTGEKYMPELYGRDAKELPSDVRQLPRYGADFIVFILP